MSDITPQQMRELADNLDAEDGPVYMGAGAVALRTAADQLEAVQALSDSWKREGVAPDFWVELNRALRSSDITPRA